MGLKEVLERLGSDASVKAAFPLEGKIRDMAIAEEGSVSESSMGMPLDNRALKEVLKRTNAVCLFCGSMFEVPEEHIMIMEDEGGNIIGHDIPKCMADDFKDDPDLIMLCDDFAMRADKADMRGVVFVMLPQNVKCVGEREGVRNAVLLYPATTTDMILRRHFGISLGEPDIASAILAFDII